MLPTWRLATAMWPSRRMAGSQHNRCCVPVTLTSTLMSSLPPTRS